jgi:hypothetical protein
MNIGGLAQLEKLFTRPDGGTNSFGVPHADRASCRLSRAGELRSTVDLELPAFFARPSGYKAKLLQTAIDAGKVSSNAGDT